VGAVVSEVNVAQDGHPIEFDGFGGLEIGGDGGRGTKGELMGVGAFEVEGEAGLRINERNRATESDFFEIGRLTRGERGEEGLIGGEVDFAAGVVRQALGIVTDFSSVESFVAVVGMVGNSYVAFVLGGGDAELLREIGTLRRRDCGVETLRGEASHSAHYCTYFEGRAERSAVLLGDFSKKEV